MELFSVLSRVVPAVFFAIVCYGFWLSFARTGKWTSLLWMFSEGLVVLLFVFRRDSSRISQDPRDWIAGFGGTFAALLVLPTTSSIVPEYAGVALQLTGNLFEAYGKLSLGRSFGIVAANRGIVLRGAYKIVRHPIYLGYLITHVGFLLTNWSIRNIAVYAAVYFFQTARILSEERLLKEDPSYAAYCDRVRYRLIPGIF